MPRKKKRNPNVSLCRNGLHEMIPINTRVDKKGHKRCIACIELSIIRKHGYMNPRPLHSGVCTKGLHEWVPKNWIMDKDGNARCKPCRLEYRRRTSTADKSVYCIAKGCNRKTMRSKGRIEAGETYICPSHRMNPPKWLYVLGFQVKGTCVVRAT